MRINLASLGYCMQGVLLKQSNSVLITFVPEKNLPLRKATVNNLYMDMLVLQCEYEMCNYVMHTYNTSMSVCNNYFVTTFCKVYSGSLHYALHMSNVNNFHSLTAYFRSRTIRMNLQEASTSTCHSTIFHLRSTCSTLMVHMRLLTFPNVVQRCASSITQ